MHPIEPYLPALNRYAKALVRGKHHIDYRDVVNEAVMACLNANPERLTQGYVLTAARSRAFNLFKKNTDEDDIDDYEFASFPYDLDAMYENETLLNWAEIVLRRERDRERDSKRNRSAYYATAEYREKKRVKYRAYYKKKKHEKEIILEALSIHPR